MTRAAEYEFRHQMVEALSRDLLGPSTPDEVLVDAPLEQYITGVLYPFAQGMIDPDEDIDEADEDEERRADPGVALANRRYPSSMGMTFAVDITVAATLTVRVDAARYIQVDEEAPKETPGETSRGRRRRVGNLGSGKRWQRVVLPIPELSIGVETPADRRHQLGEGVELFVRVRRADESGIVPVTLVLVNRQIAPPGFRDAFCLFQPVIHVSGPEGTAPFTRRRIGAPAVDDADLRSYELLYRHAGAFAVGHGCSAVWNASSGDNAYQVETSFVPEFELRLADSNPAISASSLSMMNLARGARNDVLVGLEALCAGYDQWILDTRAQAESEFSDTPTLLRSATEQLDAAANALQRMRDGVGVLRDDDAAWRAFTLANEAMLIQRARAVWHRNGRPTGGPVYDESHTWRPFQAAFMLMTLPGIADPSVPEREVVDLLWFPTGGGKTEAYLGLIAFTALLRRLKRGHAGVTALMRYTLRLLTIQQFERATLLIAACEYLRRTTSDLGKDAFSIGLWVGRDATPLDRKEASDALKKLSVNGFLESGNPVQLHRCPWCGTALDYRNYYVTRSNPRLVVDCRNKECDFEGGLPVFLVDEDLYDFRPTLIISTVDKFASLPWRDRVSSLFNLGTSDGPPELIIQDELHLISGPLGTLTGLYETAIELLATKDGIGPKVIASTATIRRAADQALGLFARSVRQFPPPGIDARDSYFAVEMLPEEKGTRLYVGLSAPGTSQSTLLIRAYAALLQAAKDIKGDDSARDPYWTLVGYFNSLRVLGAANIQVRDDVADRLELLASRAGTEPRAIQYQIELTSREASSVIPKHLAHMEVAYPDIEALDVIRATNMISVGVDIDRLGLMVVMGQPQATSEYIQATSRVGRQHPGLVVTLLNSAKSRDRSHYESFMGYHSALYRQVEATSVTPFSPRARDRALHAVLVGLARLTIPEFADNAGADAIARHADKLGPVVDAIVRRAELVEPSSATATRRHLNALIDGWRQRQIEQGSGTLYYSRHKAPDISLLGDPMDDDDGAFPTMWSLRDVDAASNLFLER